MQGNLDLVVKRSTEYSPRVNYWDKTSPKNDLNTINVLRPGILQESIRNPID